MVATLGAGCRLTLVRVTPQHRRSREHSRARRLSAA